MGSPERTNQPPHSLTPHPRTAANKNCLLTPIAVYGENRFVHLMRDPPAADVATPLVLRGVYGGLRIPVHQYGHLIRHVGIVVEANRMADREHRDNFTRSIAKLGPGGGLPFPANLHTVTIEVPALCVSDMGGWHQSESDLYSVPICDFFDEKAIAALKRLSTKFIRIVATERRGLLLEGTIDLRSYSTKLHHDRDGEGGDDPATRDQVLMDSREAQARKAIAQLQIIRHNLLLLALYPRTEIRDRRMWTIVERQKPVVENVELADDFNDWGELESPSPQPRKKRAKGRLTEKWLEGAQDGNGGEDLIDVDSPVNDLEEKLNRLKFASPSKATATATGTATTPAAHKDKGKGKGKAKATPVAAPSKKDKKKRTGDESRPPLNEAAQIRINERMDSINRKAAPGVALIKAERIAAEKRKAAEQAAAAAREAVRTAERNAAEKEKEAQDAIADARKAAAAVKDAEAVLNAFTQGSARSGRGSRNKENAPVAGSSGSS